MCGPRNQELVRILNDDNAFDNDLVIEWFIATFNDGPQMTPGKVTQNGVVDDDASNAPLVLFEGYTEPRRLTEPGGKEKQGKLRKTRKNLKNLQLYFFS